MGSYLLGMWAGNGGGILAMALHPDEERVICLCANSSLYLARLGCDLSSRHTQALITAYYLSPITPYRATSHALILALMTSSHTSSHAIILALMTSCHTSSHDGLSSPHTHHRMLPIQNTRAFTWRIMIDELVMVGKLVGIQVRALFLVLFHL